MNKIYFIASLFFIFNFSFSQSISLFNGNDLSGWNIHGTEKWYVENGDLVCESGPENEYGYLSTEKFYDDFILTLEFKQVSNGNSGVFFRSTLEGTKISGWQVEVAPPVAKSSSKKSINGPITKSNYITPTKFKIRISRAYHFTIIIIL